MRKFLKLLSDFRPFAKDVHGYEGLLLIMFDATAESRYVLA